MAATEESGGRIEVKEYLRVQGASSKTEKYVRVRIPSRVAEEHDIKVGDLVRISIERHIKVGREEESDAKAR